MKVVNLVSWAGPRFAYEPGQEIELDDVTARARLAAGLVAEVASTAKPAPTVSRPINKAAPSGRPHSRRNLNAS